MRFAAATKVAALGVERTRDWCGRDAAWRTIGARRRERKTPWLRAV
jgi:hypothetical protein